MGNGWAMETDKGIVFIGGLGGSGTRAVTEAIENLGYYPGGNLNSARDNLVFSVLMKHPVLLRNGSGTAAIRRRLTLHRSIMCSGVKFSDVFAHPGLLRYKKTETNGLQDHPNAYGWLTKEPNSHLFMDTILTMWPEAVFIHVSRHPLDMAFSNNKQQLQNWAWFFDINIDAMGSIEAAQLEYWIASERRLRTIMKAFGSRVYNLKFEAFAIAPQEQLSAMIDALGIKADSEYAAKAVCNVKPPKTMGRWRKHDLSQFSAGQLDACRELGWPIE